MKFFVLSDKPDVYLGMRLAGMDGAVVENRTEALDKIRELTAIRRDNRLPVMTRISDRSGESATKGLERYVHESLGINL